MEKIYGMHTLTGLQLFWSGTPTFSSGNSCFQNPSESSDYISLILVFNVVKTSVYSENGK